MGAINLDFFLLQSLFTVYFVNLWDVLECVLQFLSFKGTWYALHTPEKWNEKKKKENNKNSEIHNVFKSWISDCQ